jgi:apolipoprotein D and lipocalin family protein
MLPRSIRPRYTLRHMKKFLILACACACLAACGRVPEGIEPVSGFELDRYLGTWYEIARLDHRFERGLTDITARYSLRDGGGVAVLNRGWDTAKGDWREAEGKARFVGAEDVASLEVSFFGPFYGGYNVVDLDPSYSLALVAGPNRDYLWILARSPEPPREEVERLVRRADELGFDTSRLIYVTHERAAGQR